MYTYFSILIAIIFISFILKYFSRKNKKYYELFDTIQLVITIVFFISQILAIIIEAFRDIL